MGLLVVRETRRAGPGPGGPGRAPGRPARGGGHRPAQAAAHRRPHDRRAAAGAAHRARGLRRSRPRRRRPELRRRRVRGDRPARRAAGPSVPAGLDALPAARAAARERRPRDRRRGAQGRRRRARHRGLRAERLLRHVHALLEKKPTISLPSALEVLRTKVGDCNEHTALYVAMARSLGLPARVAVGLVQLRGAFYYHAWPEVWIDEAAGRGRWLAVDPTLNQFPADATHVRLARGGLDKQAAILGLIGRASLDVLEVQLRPGAVPVLVGRAACGPAAARPRPAAPPERGGCWSSPGKTPMIRVEDLVKTFGRFRAVDGVSLDVAPGEIHGFLGPNGAGKTTTIRMIAGLLKPTSGRVDDRRPRPRARDRGRPSGRSASSPTAPSSTRSSRRSSSCASTAGLYGLEGPPLERRALRAAGDLRARLLARRAGRELLARHEAAAGDVRGLPARAARRAGRRADGRPRPARRAADQGRVPRA